MKVYAYAIITAIIIGIQVIQIALTLSIIVVIGQVRFAHCCTSLGKCGDSMLTLLTYTL